jgi:deoxyribodipyrimidine photo-lyase
MLPTDPFAVCWFRRDLRLQDQHAFFEALKSGLPVIPLFIFDRNILDKLDQPDDRRVRFLHSEISALNEFLNKSGAGFWVEYGHPGAIFEKMASGGNLKAVFCNHDYEPYALKRDASIAEMLGQKGVSFQSFKDQVIFEKEEVLSGQRSPYTVFTPYSKRWKALLQEKGIPAYPSEKHLTQVWQGEYPEVPSLESMGFQKGDSSFPDRLVPESLIREYGEKRDYPGLPGTSRLSVHLRFGTVSIRQLVQKATRLSETWLNELIWREFYMQILWHFPRVGEGKSFKPAYDRIEWRNDRGEFERWCQGKTGYPIVDAGMRELRNTGFMHNRVRMITASFLVKHLLIDWRWGEEWFAKHLLDFDFSANNGGWQWAAGSGCDAAPYFRVFNPYLQTQKFDKDLKYIKSWVPEYNEAQYLASPVVQHEFARKRVLEAFKKALAENTTA